MTGSARMAVIAVTLAVAACTGEAEPADDETVAALPADADAHDVQTAPDEGDEPAGGAEQIQTVVEVGDVANHPNGVQVRVERFELTEASTVVLLGVTNGADFPVSLDGGQTLLHLSESDGAAGAGEPSELAEPLEPSTVEPGEDIILALRFGPTTARGATLELNVGGGSSVDSPRSRQPSFVLGPYELDAAGARPPLPPSAGLALTASHANGSEAQVTGVAFTDSRIGLRARLSNGATFEIGFPDHVPHLLVDDLGNEYRLLLPPDGDLTVPPGEALAGVLVFAGRVHPDATALELVLNDGSGGSPDSPSTRRPTFRLGPMPLTGEGPAGAEPADLAPGDEAVHPQGTQVRLDAIRFGTDVIELDVEIANGGSVEVALFPNSQVHQGYVADDAGNRYPLVPPEDNPDLRLAPGTGLHGTLVFSGRLAADAAEVTLHLNDGGGGSADSPSTRRPIFRLGPYRVDRHGDAGQGGDALVFAVGQRTHLVDEAIAASAVDEVALILSQFDAVEVDGGVLLTLPDAVLFDFDRADLRADARQALALVAEVLRHYEPDPVLVVGHTDSVGIDAYNQDLSERRARAVVESLIGEHGIDGGRLEAEGRGLHEPVAPNTHPDGRDDPEGRQLNRRVEVLILTDRGLPGG